MQAQTAEKPGKFCDAETAKRIWESKPIQKQAERLASYRSRGRPTAETVPHNYDDYKQEAMLGALRTTESTEEASVILKRMEKRVTAVFVAEYRQQKGDLISINDWIDRQNDEIVKYGGQAIGRTVHEPRGEDDE